LQAKINIGCDLLLFLSIIHPCNRDFRPGTSYPRFPSGGQTDFVDWRKSYMESKESLWNLDSWKNDPSWNDYIIPEGGLNLLTNCLQGESSLD
jgi:hypothetical protein